MQDAKNKYFKKEYLIEAHFYVKGRFKLHVPDCQILLNTFSFWSGTQKQMHISKKAQRKSLVRAIY